MKKHLLLSFALLFAMMLGKGFSQDLRNAFSKDLLFEQTMDEEAAGGITSANMGGNDFEVADNFTDVDGTVNQVVFYGLYAFHDGVGWANVDPGESLEFNVRFFDHDETHPDWDNPIAEYLDIETSSIDHSWQWGNGFDVWMFTIDIPDTYVDNGWVSIQSQGGDGWFLWHTSADGDGYAWQEDWAAKDFGFANLDAKGSSTSGTKDPLDDDLAFEFYGTEGDNGEDPEGHEVTFFVDMEDVEGFDPHEHSVFVTGNFADWADPGTESSLELEWVDNTKSEIIFYENFADGEIPTGWINLDESGDGFEWFIVPDNHDPIDGDYAIASASWDPNVGPLTPDNWLITPQIANVHDDYELSFHVKAQDPDWVHEKYDVLVSTTGNDPDDFTSIHSETLADGEWKEVVLSLEDFAGEDIYIAFRHWDSTDWFRIVIDAIKVEATENGNGEDPEDLIYSGTIHFEGELQYKYATDLLGDGWDGAEWPGDPNRIVHVDGDMELHDIFGVQPDPVEEFTVTFEIEDEDGDPVEEAIVTLGDVTNDPGDYVFEDVEAGTYDYMVEKDGFITYEGDVEVTDDMTVPVVLEAVEMEEFVYSIAMMLPAGEYEYKYFLVVDDPTWDLGEWEGDPNRSVMVEAEMTVEDIWGDQPENDNGDPAKDAHDEYIVTFEVTIEEGTLVEDIAFDPDEHHIFIAGSFPGDWTWNEPGSNPVLELTTTDDDPIVSAPDISLSDVAVNIFPNPANDVFYIESDAQISEIRMFDVLGQVVYTHAANDRNHTINIGGMNAGVYFVQITTEAGVVTQRVQVTR